MLKRLLIVLDVLLLVAGGALAVQLYRIWTATPSAASPPPAAASAVAPAPPAPPPARSLSPSALGIIAERNLFSPTRAEVAAEAPKSSTAMSAGPPRPAESPRLYGIVLGADGGSRAYLWDPQTRKVFAYKVGDSVADSRLERIAADRVVLRRGGQTFEVLLRDPTKPKPVAAPPIQIPTAGPTPVVPGAGSAEQPGAPEGAPTVTFPGQLPGQPFVPTPRPGVPTFPPRPSIRIPSGAPVQPQPVQPQSSREAGS